MTAFSEYSGEHYLHFAVQGRSLDLDVIQRTSDKLNETLIGRPIFVYDFDPEAAPILLREEFEVKKLYVNLNPWIAYYEIKFRKNSVDYTVYIFDHRYEQERDYIRIINRLRHESCR